MCPLSLLLLCAYLPRYLRGLQPSLSRPSSSFNTILRTTQSFIPYSCKSQDQALIQPITLRNEIPLLVSLEL